MSASRRTPSCRSSGSQLATSGRTASARWRNTRRISGVETLSPAFIGKQIDATGNQLVQQLIHERNGDYPHLVGALKRRRAGGAITIVQAPSGASIEYTTNIMKQAANLPSPPAPRAASGSSARS